MITLNIGVEERTSRNELPLEQIRQELAKGPDGLLWLDVVAPTPEELQRLAEEFELHPLAVEDAAKRHQRPKLDYYDDFLLLVFYELTIEGDRPRIHEILFFAGANYVITIHDQPCGPFAEAARRWESRRDGPEHPEKRGTGFLIYALLDAIVDDYFPVADALEERIERLEERIFEAKNAGYQREVFAFRKDLTTIRRILGPERDVMNILVRRDSPAFGAETVVYFQDVYDHILRVIDHIEAYRDLLASALDAALSVTSNRLNVVMKTLTASSIILMSMSLVAGVYGMNFDKMPELHWRYGYAWALGLMAAIGLGLIWLFRRIKWL